MKNKIYKKINSHTIEPNEQWTLINIIQRVQSKECFWTHALLRLYCRLMYLFYGFKFSLIYSMKKKITFITWSIKYNETHLNHMRRKRSSIWKQRVYCAIHLYGRKTFFAREIGIMTFFGENMPEMGKIGGQVGTLLEICEILGISVVDMKKMPAKPE